MEFRASRPDGRSDRQVVFELVADAAPDTTFDYGQLTAALAVGLAEPPDRGRVYRAVAQCNRTLLRERKRYLGVVKGTGYRVLGASDHLPTALVRKSRAEVQISRGVEILRHVRFDELSPDQRKLHEGQLLILSGLHTAVRESNRRHDRSEQLIDELTRRIERLERGDER